MKNERARKREAAGPGKITLPSSGLAEDILGVMAPSSQTDGQTLPVGLPTGSVPERIYSFADRLKRGVDERVRKTTERLETWVTFVLGDESYGLPVTHVQEILRVTEITPVPHAPHPVRGVINMRGRVLPVVDLRVRLNMPEASPGSASRILVVSSRGRILGLLVDAVRQVLRLDETKIQPPPLDVMTSESDYIRGVYHVQEELVVLLDVDRLLAMKRAS